MDYFTGKALEYEMLDDSDEDEDDEFDELDEDEEDEGEFDEVCTSFLRSSFAFEFWGRGGGRGEEASPPGRSRVVWRGRGVPPASEKCRWGLDLPTLCLALTLCFLPSQVRD